MLEIIGLQPHYWVVPVVGGSFLVLGFLLFGLKRWLYQDQWYGGEAWTVGSWFAWVIGILILIACIFIYMPFNSKYWYNYKLSGTVESVTNKLENGNAKFTGSPIIKLSGYSEPIIMNDSRILTLEGREVDLTCSIKWAYEGLDATACSVRMIK
jgi:hypothetical protein